MFTLHFSFRDKHAPEGMLEQNQEVSPADTYAKRALETRDRASKKQDHSEDTNSSNHSRVG